MTDDELNTLLGAHESAGEPRFAPVFADRVMRRVAERGAPTLDLMLARQARRVLPALAAASMLLALWNYVSLRDRAPSTIGAVLGVASNSVVGSENPGVSNGLVNVEVFE